MRRKRRRRRKKRYFIRVFKRGVLLLAVLVLAAAGYAGYRDRETLPAEISGIFRDVLGAAAGTEDVSSLEQIPEYEGEPYVTVNHNQPEFSKEELEAEPYEHYSRQDILGRCQYAEAKISRELMPEGEREDISEVKPSGWKTASYEEVDGGFLYNRCHLIGFQLTGENANERNLITGTRYMNVEGMLPFEDEVAGYVKKTGKPVLYRVTPRYEGGDLVAKGVQMEARSVEDKKICFNVFVFNVQPGIEIDYGTGESREE